MKKVLLIIGFLVSVNLIFAQSQVSLSLPSIEVTGAAQNVDVNVHIDFMTANLVVGVQMSILYDQNYLTWLGTATVPGPGVPYLHPGFTAFGSDYLWNTNFPGNLIMLWSDPTYVGFPAFAGENIITYRFAYNGGLAAGQHSPISYSLTYKMKDGGYVKIVNELTDENFSPFEFVGACGGLCPGEIFRAGGATAPVADFIGTPLTGVAPLTVNFTDLSTNTPTSWAWTFGDAGTSTLQNPSHIYAPGTYTVALTATNAGGSNTMTKTGYIVVTAPCTPGLWTGNGDGTNWFDPLNWDCGVVPVGVDVTIPETGKSMVTISGGIAVVGGLTLTGPGANLHIAYDGGLTTNGIFNNNGNFVIESENALGYSGTYINNAGIIGTGTFEFDRQMTCTGTTMNGTDPNWHYLAAPLSGFTTWNMFDYYVNSWSEPTGLWNHIGGMAPGCIPGPNVPLNSLEAWSVNYANDYSCGATNPGTGMTLEFMGGAAAMHSGAYSLGATFTPGAYQGWNMFANPYPAGLDMNMIAFDPNMVPGAAFYEACTGNYLYWTPALGSYVMPVGNGFFTEWTGAGLFGVTNAARAHNADYFWKADVSDLVTLQITGNEKSDLTYIRFMENAEVGFAKDGDFHKLFSTAVPQIYTTAGEDMLAINCLPETATVPMGMTSEVSGSYTISAIETSEFQNVVLEDLFNGAQTDLLTSSYTFEYNVGDNANRFVVHFTPLGTPELNANSINIWAANHNIYVQAPVTTGDIVVYNMMGQEVVRTDIKAGLNVIPMTDVDTYYIVKVIGSDVTETGKVFIK
jgi:PKD repeat protein